MQSMAFNNIKKYYIFFDRFDSVFSWDDIICISIKKDIFRFIKLNFLIFFLIHKLKRNKVILHSHNSLMSFFLYKRTDIFTVHDGLYYSKKLLNQRILFMFEFIEQIVYKRSKYLHFVSKYALKESLFKLGRKKHTIIYDTTHLEQLTESISNANNAKVNNTNIFSVRSIEERARIDLLIDVAIHYQKNGKNIFIYVAGKGPLLNHYRELIQKKNLKNIVLLGYISDADVVNYYKKSDIVIVTSEYGEGFGLPIIEGYLFDKPVIASNKCAIPEIIINKEFLFDNFSEKIIEIINNIELISKNYNFKNYYFNNFSNRLVISQYKLLYEQLFAL